MEIWKNTGEVVPTFEYVSHITCDDNCRAEIYWSGSKEKAIVANNKMLAASQLLEAAMKLLETIEAYELEDEIDAGEDEDGAVKTLRSAINKAKGIAPRG